MKRLPGPLVACISINLLLTAGAQASDIACKNTLRSPAARCDDLYASPSPCRENRQANAATLICDYAMLYRNHERIHAQQQRLLRTGVIAQDDIAAWRRRRDACTSVACLDSVFASWQPHRNRKPAPRASAPQPNAPEAPVRNIAKNGPQAAPKMAPQPTLASRPQPAPPVLVPQPAPAHEAESGSLDDRLPPVAIDRPRPASIPLRTSPPRALAPRQTGWESLGTLAWLGMCSAGICCWSRRTRGEWLPGAHRMRERLRDASAMALTVCGLLMLNAVLFLCILAQGASAS
ncbi:hypothetical protein Tamer19_68610 [Cupriavidus sp. TA19]|uniref:hypothetical protein n=1 Tax=Cupriavidus sp. TA19 TaxID=701108 RepID=UPI0027294C51|nr:hypothetical protein [Cupriavidus sp. TA19]GLC97452.1 hypothetical protein Tamer19_68610 [Cupriavidus sp. TA19]